MYSSGSIPDPGGWKQPVGWTGPGSVLHWSLDNLDGLVLMEGTQQKDYDALTDGKVAQSITSNLKTSYLKIPSFLFEIASTNLAEWSCLIYE